MTVHDLARQGNAAVLVSREVAEKGHDVSLQFDGAWGATLALDGQPIAPGVSFRGSAVSRLVSEAARTAARTAAQTSWRQGYDAGMKAEAQRREDLAAIAASNAEIERRLEQLEGTDR